MRVVPVSMAASWVPIWSTEPPTVTAESWITPETVSDWMEIAKQKT